jgi:hypothetical protein
MLIDQHTDALAGRKQPHRASHCTLTVDHRISSDTSRLFEQRVQERIVERSREHRHRAESKPVRESVLLPESEMTRTKEDPAATSERVLNTILALPIDELEHARMGQRAELQQLHEHVAEMREHLSGNRAPLGV